MLALVKENHEVTLREIPAPVIRHPDDVRVRVRSAGVCTTDLAVVYGNFGGPEPRVIGHEVAGEVIETGSAVRSLSSGDSVVLQPTNYCRRCAPCREGNWHLCPNRKFIGLDIDGGFAGEMPEILLDQTGDPQLLRESMDIISRKGTLFIYDFVGSEIPFHFGVMQLREITIRTSTGCPGETMPRALALMAEKVDVSPAITHIFTPDRMKEAFETLKSRDPSHVKSVIEFP